MNRKEPDIELLQEAVEIDAEGAVRWIARPAHHFLGLRWHTKWNRGRPGSLAFNSDKGKGYRGGEVSFAGERYVLLLHRVKYALHHGAWPAGVIDHIDGNPCNNDIQNLRDVSQSVNRRNSRMTGQNTSGVMGVRRRDRKKNPYSAQIKVEGRAIALGVFPTFEEAVAARRAAEVKYGFTPRRR